METYADYCKALHHSDENARLMYAVRSWFNELQLKLEQGTSDLLIADLCPPEYAGLKQDAFSRLLAECQRPLDCILKQPHQKILRENTMTPAHKVRELDSAGISWLERRPGRTMREKMRNSRSILAVGRRMSLDTDENRLLKTFVRRCRDIAHLKLDGLSSEIDTSAEDRFLRTAAMLRKMSEMEEVREWSAPQPNLVLISDRQYSQLWKAWIALNELDQQTKQDAEQLSEHIAVILWAQFFISLRGQFRLPQLPLKFDLHTCTLDLAVGPAELQAMGEDGQILKLKRTPGRLWVQYQGKTAELIVIERTVRIQLRGGKSTKTKTLMLTAETLLTPVCILREMLDIPETPVVSAARTKTSGEIIDLFTLQPLFYTHSEQGGAFHKLRGPLLGQELKMEQKQFRMACADTKAIWLGADSRLFSVESAVREGRSEQLRVLTETLKKYLNTKTLTCLVPDIYSEFELNPLRAAMHLAYPSLQELPRSIATAFACARSETWRKGFHANDYMLIVDLQGIKCSMTMLRGICADGDESRLIWERHLRQQADLSKPCRKNLQKLYDSLENKGGLKDPETLAEILGIEGLLYLSSHMSFWQKDGSWTKQVPEKIALDVTSCVNDFVQEYRQKQQIEENQIYVVLLSTRLNYAGLLLQARETSISLLQGCQYYENCQKEYKGPLWYDYLPKLAIRRLKGKIELVDPANIRVDPGLRERKQISVKGLQFTLPKGRKSYRFGLIQGNSTSGVQYEAVLKHHTFPLTEDLDCELKLFYTYGAEEPYELFFCPTDTAQAPFRELRVRWEQQKGVDASQLPSPPFPQTGWDDLQRKAENQKYTVLQRAIHTLNSVSEEAKLPRHTCTLAVPLKPEDWINADTKEPMKPEDWAIKENERSERRYPNIPKAYARAYVQAADGIGFWAVQLRTDWFDEWSELQQSITKISCTLISPKDKIRYENLRPVDFGNSTWRSNERGQQLILVDRENKRKYMLYESYFVHGTFNANAEEYSFTAEKSWPDKKAPDFICVQGRNIFPGRVTDFFIGQNVRVGSKRSFRAEQQLNFFALDIVFGGGRKLSDPECPDELRLAVKEAAPALLEAFRQYPCAADAKMVSKKVFSAICLLAPSMGEPFYSVILEKVEARWNLRNICNALGAALGDLTLSGQQKLLDACSELYEDTALCILAKAVWSHENFVRNADPRVLIQWLRTAIRLLGAIYLEETVQERFKPEHAVRYIEYVLGVFRLRGVENQAPEILEALSLNNPDIQKLQKCAEAACDQQEKSDLRRTRIRFQKPAAEEYRDIPDLLYALLKYITGESGEEIIITGIEDAEDEND